MSVNINNCNYSYANAIGSSLKQPLFKLVSYIARTSDSTPEESQAQRIAKVAFHCLVVAILIIPLGSAWLVGKSISYFSKTQINLERLSLAPPELKVPQEIESDQAINIMTLSEKYNQLNLSYKTPSDKNLKQQALYQLCCETVNNINNTNQFRTDLLFYKQLSIYLKGIIKKIDSGKISDDKVKSILMELAEASTRCRPTWLETSAKLFAEVNDEVETAEVKLLRFVQEYKETITLEYFQQEVNVQWHSLNYVRNILGKELGLNTTLNVLDPYASIGVTIFPEGLIKWLFLQRYENVNRLISSVQTMINKNKYDVSYYDFLLNAVKKKDIANPVAYVEQHFYSEDFKLTEAGVNFMLKCIGIIK